MKTFKASGIISSIHKGPEDLDTYTLLCGGHAVNFSSNIGLSLMESVDVEYDESFKAIRVESKGNAEGGAYQLALSSLVKRIGVGANAASIDFGKVQISDGEGLKAALSESADALLRSYISGAPLIVRFHNDGDGSTGALALYRALADVDSKVSRGGRQSSWIMNKSIAYTVESAYLDANLFDQHSSVEKPILLITDFGTSEESMRGIGFIRGKAGLIWVDHHMPYSGFSSEGLRYMNSWNFGSDSNLTAGALSSLLAQALSGARYDELIRASFISDYSKYADANDAAAVRLATVLDYLTAKNKNGLTPKQIESVISDKERYATTFATATEQMDEALSLGVNSANKYQTDKGVGVYVVDFSPIAEKEQGFPLPGRYSSRLQARLEDMNGERVITVVHFGSFISMRVSKAISGEVDILRVIEKLKVSDAEISGGGHAEAASVRVQNKNLKDALKLLLVELGARQ